ncbi:GAF domain-containing protein [Jiangella rhizosphaerae]|uniref:histidine kinase n=1 Tax=Jiangella rhizosphaerae TaxID=2293569 RepID=A0A418KPM7_9ACTN|nr:GAF domain-containing protein [Jiangella rhizosphaerae]RIQ21068.1 GAF domain-containing protein [Jiangella rhizosphaerae]
MWWRQESSEVSDVLTGRPLQRWAAGVATGVVLVVVATGVVWLLNRQFTPRGLLVVYLLAVLPVAMRWGAGPAILVAALGVGTFLVVIAPPRTGGPALVALGVFVATAVIVAGLAAGLRRSIRESQELAAEQSALRRVATLVAEGVPAPELFEAVSREVGLLCDADLARLERYEPDGTVTGVGSWARVPARLAVGTRIELDGVSVAREVRRTGGPARVSGYAYADGAVAAEARELGIRSSIGCPIIVDGHLWGVVVASSKSAKAFPPGTEARIQRFTELVATAVTNAEARAAVRRNADEQAALRRVATLAARGDADPSPVFAIVADQVRTLLGADCTSVLRFESDETATYLAARGWRDAERRKPGAKWYPEEPSVIENVRRTGQPARLDYSDVKVIQELPPSLRSEGIRSAVASPIVVESRLWGSIGVGSRTRLLPADTEQRLIAFTEVVATAIANTESRTELARSRARVIAAADATRRRLERDLHDGAQQRLVSLALELRNTQAEVPAELPELSTAVGRLADDVTQVLDQLRELSRGIHPAILSEGGLGPALRTLARRSPVPVDLTVRLESRYRDAVEVAAYYVASEALTNAVKHAEADHVEIVVEERDGVLHLLVADDGGGGADQTRGTGLTGLYDRVASLGGTMRVSSPVGDGTRIQVHLPLQTS